MLSVFLKKQHYIANLTDVFARKYLLLCGLWGRETRSLLLSPWCLWPGYIPHENKDFLLIPFHIQIAQAELQNTHFPILKKIRQTNKHRRETVNMITQSRFHNFSYILSFVITWPQIVNMSLRALSLDICSFFFNLSNISTCLETQNWQLHFFQVRQGWPQSSGASQALCIQSLSVLSLGWTLLVRG